MHYGLNLRQIEACHLVRISPLSHSRTSSKAGQSGVERSGAQRSSMEGSGAERCGASEWGE